MFGGYSVLSATLKPDGRTVALTIDKPLARPETLWIWSATDLGGNSASQLIGVNVVSAAGASAAWSSSTMDAPPQLFISRAGESLVLSWVQAGQAFALESKEPEAAQWTPVTEAVTLDGGVNRFTVTANGARLYRLVGGGR